MSAPFLSTSTLLSDANTAQSLVYWLALGLVAGGLTLMGVVLLDRWKRRKRESASDAAGVPMGTIPEAERLLQLMGEAEELCGRLSAELDQKAEHLQRLIDRAEQYSAQPIAPAVPQPTRAVQPQTVAPAAAIADPTGPLSRLLREQHAADMAPPPPPPPASVQPAPARQPEIVTRVPERRVPVQAATQPMARESAPAPVAAAAPTSSPATGLEPLASQIYQLADRGMTPREIAQSLQQHPGKVELILALRST